SLHIACAEPPDVLDGAPAEVQLPTLRTYPPATSDPAFVSQDYQVWVRPTGGTTWFKTPTYQHVKRAGTQFPSEPQNVLNAGKIDALDDSDHFTTFSFGGQAVDVYIDPHVAVTDCAVYPARWNIQCTPNRSFAQLSIPDIGVAATGGRHLMVII